MDGIVTCAKESFAILTWNPAAKAIFGYTEDEMARQSLTRLFSREEEGSDISDEMRKAVRQSLRETECTEESRRLRILVGSPERSEVARMNTKARVLRRGSKIVVGVATAVAICWTVMCPRPRRHSRGRSARGSGSGCCSV